MDEDNNNEPVERFRGIMAGDEEGSTPKPAPAIKPQKQSEQPKPQSTQSVLSQLPKKQTSTPPATQPEQDVAVPAPKHTPPKVIPQGVKKQVSSQSPKQKAPPLSQSPELPATTPDTQPMLRREKLLRALWTITSVISMTVNVAVIIILLLAVSLLRGFKFPTQLPDGIDIMVLNNLLSGLYSNFELMDAAKISAIIPVQDQIPVQFDLEINQSTTVTLSEDVTIRGAYVVIDTPVIDISAPAVVTLPQGTNLPIILNLVVPVDKKVPVNLNVAVDIPLSQTELHTPFVGLQEVVKPLYCLVDPAAASSLTGEPVCAK